MIVHVCKIGFRFTAHVALDFAPFWMFVVIVESGYPVDVVSTNTIDQRFYWTERAFVEDEVTRDYVYWTQETVSSGCTPCVGFGGLLTLPDRGHFGLQ